MYIIYIVDYKHTLVYYFILLNQYQICNVFKKYSKVKYFVFSLHCLKFALCIENKYSTHKTHLF